MDQNLKQVITLDFYPHEILIKIVDYVGIENLINLLTDQNQPFLDSHHNLKSCINHVIENGKFLQYNNRINRPSYIHMYLRIENFTNKSNLSFLSNEEDFLILNNYCSRNNLKIELYISYYIWNLIDIINFRRLVTNISIIHKNDDSIKYNIELEFQPSFQYFLILNSIFEKLLKFGSNINSITIDDYNLKFDLNLTKFPNLKKLWLNNCENITITGLKESKLEYLNLHKIQRDIVELIVEDYLNIDEIPPTVQDLRLSDINITNCIRHQIATLTLDTINFVDLETISTLINSTYKNLTVRFELIAFDIYLHARDTIGPHIKVNHPYQSFTSNLPVIPQISALQELCIQNLHDPESLYNLKFNDTLKKVTFSNNEIDNLSRLIRKFSSFDKIEYLNLADNPIDWHNCTKNFENFINLKYLKLSNTHIGLNLPLINLPDSIEQLSLEVNQIESIDQIKFPQNLVNLGIGSNKIRIVYKPNFPITLKTIHFTENLISKVDLSTNNRGEILRIEILYLNYNKINNMANLKLPNSNTLKILNLDRCNIPNLDFKILPSIEELSFIGCSIEEVHLDCEKEHYICSKLKYLCLSLNRIKTFSSETKLPNSILNLNLSINEFSKIPTQISNLKNLESLILSENDFTSITYDFRRNYNIKSLDLSFNNTSNLNLSFPKGSSTNLQIINLCSNELSDFNMSMIGHDPKSKTLHSNLIEIDLSDNHIPKESLEKLINSNNGVDALPNSLELLMYETANKHDYNTFHAIDAYEDQYSIIPDYETSLNALSRSFCVGKRVDLPSVS
ncbi:hypothetical protein KGF54_002990 [Candida jiufengensis]|uniref:uncharacterized protein n=1 Tax=Candida jiufengensis TaxID=497108 RepID=UPI002224BFCF|nr:uncharacterized protein KGF54_002990 [Candida jiufengensis]KAI5953618.1 hypothetical protein KGF54_002990 [Candida jiufengensis]